MIEVKNLSFGYDRDELFHNMDRTLEPGNIYGLLGLNGAGKSTLLKLMTGLLFPESGTLASLGYDPARRDPGFLARVFFLPEELNMPGITDREFEHVVAPLYPNFAHDQFERYLREFDIPRNRKLTKLSYGQQKKFLLSFGLACGSELLVLDEPTQGLDPNQIVEIRGLIKKIGREKTVIFSTHILSEAEATCDRIIIINSGKIVADGKTEEIREHAGKGAVLHVTLANADFESVRLKLESIPGVASVHLVEKSDDGIISLTLACPTAEDPREAVYLKIKSTDWILLNFNRKKETLESVFHDLTRKAVN